MAKPVITRRSGGEFSTILIGDDMVETMWFPEEGPAVTIARSHFGLAAMAKKHIEDFEKGTGP